MSRLVYKCADCGKSVVSSHATLTRTEQVGPDLRDVRTVTGEGLGTFTCDSHPSRQVAVTRDLSGGKEDNKVMRATPVSVKRHTRVRVTNG